MLYNIIVHEMDVHIFFSFKNTQKRLYIILMSLLLFLYDMKN